MASSGDVKTPYTDNPVASAVATPAAAPTVVHPDTIAAPSADMGTYHEPKVAPQGSPPPVQDQQAVLHNKEQQELLHRAQEGQWEHGFWDCFSPGDLCFKSCCCPCFAFGKTQQRLEDPSLATYKSVNAPVSPLKPWEARFHADMRAVRYLLSPGIRRWFQLGVWLLVLNPNLR